MGDVHYAKGEWIGVALDEPDGKNGGIIKGVQYFDCEPKHGIMVRRDECRAV
ncbi:CAP Gly-rich domain-containing protein [Pelagophyceae sp. CCMP2097]|nr:CAP Gly-rich domain-containing protein [Pelagophyceae sp. CCMP2097]